MSGAWPVANLRAQFFFHAGQISIGLQTWVGSAPQIGNVSLLSIAIAIGLTSAIAVGKNLQFETANGNHMFAQTGNGHLKDVDQNAHWVGLAIWIEKSSGQYSKG
jgi:hypothetical protein